MTLESYKSWAIQIIALFMVVQYPVLGGQFSQWVFLLFIVTSFFVFIFLRRTKIAFPAGFSTLLVYCLWTLISLLTSPQNIPEVAKTYAWATGINSSEWRGVSVFIRLFISVLSVGLVYNLISSRELFFKAIQAYYTGYSILILYCMVQIPLALIGIDIGSVVHQSTFGIPRIAAIFTEPVILGQILIISIPLLYFVDRFIKIPFIAPRTLFYMSLVALFFTFSTANFLGLFFACLLFGVFNPKALIRVLLVIPIPIIIFSKELYYVLIGKFANLTFDVRSLSWIYGVFLMKDYPLKGVGIGQASFFFENYPQLQYPYLLYLLRLRGRMVPMNTPLDIACETGIIGLLILGGYLIYCILYVKKAVIDPVHSNLVRGIGIGLVAFLVTWLSTPDGNYIAYFHFFLGLLFSAVKVFSISEPGSSKNSANIVNQRNYG